MQAAALASTTVLTDPRRIWSQALARLELETTPAHFTTYLRSTVGIAYDPATSVLRVAAANPFHVPWLEGRFSAAVHDAVATVVGSGVRVEFVAEPVEPSRPNRHRERPRPSARPLDALLDAEPPVPASETVPGEGRARWREDDTARQLGSPLNPRYTFDTFVVGKSNQLAHAASLAVVDQPGRAYNPLFLYGGVGLGKTHLLHAIGQSVTRRGLSVVYVSSETFTNELIEAIRQHRTDDFRAKFRHPRVLLIDDVQFIAGKERTEEEFFHTFNAIHEAGGQIVLSSDRSPRAMTVLEDRLRSRFEWGLLADVQVPDYETRIAILRSKLNGSLGEAVPLAVVDFIAQKVQSNIRELEGTLNRLLAHALHLKQPVTVDLASVALHDLASSGPTSDGASAETILLAVSRYYAVSLEALKGRSRHREVVVPRQVAMYLLKEDARLSAPDVGRLIQRDHTTVLHGVNAVANDIARNGPCRAAVRGVRQIVAASRSAGGS
jgi:chromosomal replication initiator protein